MLQPMELQKVRHDLATEQQQQVTDKAEKIQQRRQDVMVPRYPSQDSLVVSRSCETQQSVLYQLYSRNKLV